MRNILLVEDDLGIRDALQEVLLAENYMVHVADHGKAALETLPNIPRPNLILLDLTMPVMSGWQFLKVIKEQTEYSEIPVVVFSAASQRESLPTASDIIKKPVDLDTLLQIVEKYCK